jgi:hypothetical protein
VPPIRATVAMPGRSAWTSLATTGYDALQVAPPSLDTSWEII